MVYFYIGFLYIVFFSLVHVFVHGVALLKG